MSNKSFKKLKNHSFELKFIQLKIKKMANITLEGELMKKKSKEYDEMFYSLLDKVNKGLSKEDKAFFNSSEKTLYINGKIKANDVNFIALCESYKFFIAKSLF